MVFKILTWRIQKDKASTSPLKQYSMEVACHIVYANEKIDFSQIQTRKRQQAVSGNILDYLAYMSWSLSHMPPAKF